ncbi:MAG: phosphoribosyl-AMP cyclohydrolase [Balneolaceae bacterium]
MSQVTLHERGDTEEVELGRKFEPAFDRNGLIPCLAVDHQSGEILMMAWMNRPALEQTLETGLATYYSRSRDRIWVKGESSGRQQIVQEIWVDCDQDVLQLRVRMEKEGACHQGYRSCFYRKIASIEKGELEFQKEEPLFDPKKVYRTS